jgi:hypothetical protein
VSRAALSHYAITKIADRKTSCKIEFRRKPVTKDRDKAVLLPASSGD